MGFFNISMDRNGCIFGDILSSCPKWLLISPHLLQKGEKKNQKNTDCYFRMNHISTFCCRFFQLKIINVQTGLELLEQNNTSISPEKQLKTKKNSYCIFMLFQEILKREHKIYKWQFPLNIAQVLLWGQKDTPDTLLAINLNDKRPGI